MPPPCLYFCLPKLIVLKGGYHMVEILRAAGDLTISAGIQFLVGILLALPFYKLLAAHPGIVKVHYILVGPALAVLGILLPLGPFGILPLAIALLCAGAGIEAIVPLFVSNMTFNTLMPFTEISFDGNLVWLRILAALLTGMLSFFIFRALFAHREMPVRKGVIEKFRPFFERGGLFELFSVMINEIGLFLIAGIVLSALRSYYFPDAMGALFSSGGGVALRDFLLTRNASTNPFFITSATVFNTVTGLMAPAAFLCLLKLRGVLLFYAATGLICAVFVSFAII